VKRVFLEGAIHLFFFFDSGAESRVFWERFATRENVGNLGALGL
jgi:hypothetical protein